MNISALRKVEDHLRIVHKIVEMRDYARIRDISKALGLNRPGLWKC